MEKSSCCDIQQPTTSKSVWMPDRIFLMRIAIAVAGLALCLLGILPSEGYNLVAIALVLVSGFPIYSHAWSALLERRMTMELSMAIALTAALGVGELLTSLVIVLSVLAAEEMEAITIRRGRASIQRLLDLLPRTALVRRNDHVVEVGVETVLPGEIVVVKPGSRLVVDGVVTAGHSFVDESAITGESLPQEKTAGETVFAGSMNQSGTLDVRADTIGADTAFGKIIQAVEAAERTRAQVQRTADKLAGYLVYFALAAAALTFVVTGDIRQTIAVIIVTGACGIAAGTPLAILGAIGRAAQIGSIIKGGLYLERLASVQVIAFDKTGTLTRGEPQVIGVRGSARFNQSRVLELAASAELPSEHPLSEAIVRHARKHNMRLDEPSSFEYKIGRGILCTVGDTEILVGNQSLLTEHGVRGIENVPTHEYATEVFVAIDKQYAGRIYIADVIRPEAREAVAQLQQMGLRTIILSGDATHVVRAVAKQAGITEYAGQLHPDEKRDRIARLQADGVPVAMLGDGINDAPALTEASVGIAVGSGIDVARESANVVLIGSDLLKFAETVRLSKRCRAVIYFNLIGTLTIDAVGMALAFMGMLSPLVATFIHVGSELGFLLNSARLLPIFTRKQNDRRTIA